MSTSDPSFLNEFLSDPDEDEIKFDKQVKSVDLEAGLSEGNSNTVAARPMNNNDPGKAELDTNILIENNAKVLRSKYPEGGIRASRVITSKVLYNAPQHYFDRFNDAVKESVSWIQSRIAEKNQSGIIKRSQDEPTDEVAQENAFRIIQSIAFEYLNKKNWSGRDRQILIQLISNEIIGFGPMDPLWRDNTITEIILNGPFKTEIEIAGKSHVVPACRFRDQDHLFALMKRLFESVQKGISATNPLVKGWLHDRSRIFGVHTKVMPDGPSLNIRRHPERIWTPEEIVERGSASPEIMTEIGNLIYKGASYLVVGETSTGKTSMLNALTGFYRPDARILTLEDSLEMKPNPNKSIAPSMRCVEARADDKNDKGVTMRDLVKAALQMKPDVLIVGEVTDGAAYDLCQALNTGHAGASTLHANSAAEAIPRLVSLVSQGEVLTPDQALPVISSAFDFIIFLSHSIIDGSRRISGISEVPLLPTYEPGRTPYLDIKPIWEFQSRVVNNKVHGEWVKVGNISNELVKRRGLDLERSLSWEELVEISKV